MDWQPATDARLGRPAENGQKGHPIWIDAHWPNRDEVIEIADANYYRVTLLLGGLWALPADRAIPPGCGWCDPAWVPCGCLEPRTNASRADASLRGRSLHWVAVVADGLLNRPVGGSCALGSRHPGRLAVREGTSLCWSACWNSEL